MVARQLKNFLTCVLMICLKYSMQLALPHDGLRGDAENAEISRW